MTADKPVSTDKPVTADQTAGADDSPGTAAPAQAAEAPFLRIVSGNPTDDDIAALVVLFSGLRATLAPAEPPVRTTWGRPTDLHRPSRVVAPAAESLRRSWW